MLWRPFWQKALETKGELRNEALAIEDLSRAREIQDLIDFADTVEAYAKYLENIVELNKDADKALEDLTGKK